MTKFADFLSSLLGFVLCEEEGQEGEMDSGEGERRKELLEDVRKKHYHHFACLHWNNSLEINQQTYQSTDKVS